MCILYLFSLDSELPQFALGIIKENSLLRLMEPLKEIFKDNHVYFICFISTEVNSETNIPTNVHLDLVSFDPMYSMITYIPSVIMRLLYVKVKSNR